MKKLIAVVIVVVAIFAGLAAVWVAQRADVTIGSKHFTEQRILGEIVGQLIEEHTDLSVRRRLGLQGTKVCFDALKEGDLDIYPEYTGTGLVNILNEGYDPSLDRRQVLEHVRKEFEARWGLSWMEPLGFSNSYALAMRDEQAEELGVTKVSQLAPHKNTLRPGFDHEFTMRPEYKRFEEVYGFTFGKPITKLSPDLMYKALKSDDVDVIDAFWTDGRIEAYGFRLLEDDRKLFPPYDACVLVRRDTLEKHPRLKEVLSRLAGAISPEQMRRMNFEVTDKLRSPAKVAEEFLQARGLK